MDRVRLRKVFGRFRKDELPEVMGLLDLGEGRKAASKQELVTSLVDKCMTANVVLRDVLQVELQYVISHPTSLVWRAYQLERSWETSGATVDPLVFCKRLHLYLGDVCNYELADAVRSSGHWVCLHIVEEGVLPYSCFVLHSPPTPFLLVAGVRKKHLSCILEGLSLALECAGWQDMGLTGRHVDSLLDLLVNQHSQGPYSSYRLNQTDPNPLLAVVRKRLYHQQVLSEEDTCSAKKRRAEECFGTNPLPRLEKFTFKLETPQICCQLKLTGSSVLEGVKQCVLDDHVTLPVPQCLQRMSSYASNSVLLHSNQEQSNSNNIEQSENG